MALGPVNQDDQMGDTQADEGDKQDAMQDKVNDNQAEDDKVNDDKLGTGNNHMEGHGSSSSDQGMCTSTVQAAAGKADTGNTVDAQDDDHTQGDMQAALHNTMSRNAIKAELQTKFKTNYHGLFKAQVAPIILNALVSFEQGKE